MATPVTSSMPPPRARSEAGRRDAREALALFDSYRRLADVFHEVLSEQSLDALLERIADTLGELIPHDDLAVYEADETTSQLWGVFARGALRRRGDRRRAVRLRPGDHGLGGREPRARAREPGRPRPSRPVRRGHASRSRVADRRPAHRARLDQGRAEHLSRRAQRSSARRSSGSPFGSATPPRSRSTTPTRARASSSRPRPTRSRGSGTTAPSTSGCATRSSASPPSRRRRWRC